jgi:myo-inositol 2-dehydrogenase/D-chiro-inositol 1-dehydrogenase
MTAPLRIGLIGTGRIGRVHAISIAASSDTELAYVCDPIVSGAQAVADEFGGRVTTDASDIFASSQVDAVVIASPTPTHVDLIASSLKAGIPALCEKPIDLDLSRVESLRLAVQSSDVPVALGFNRRFDPSFASVRARVAAGEIGKLEQLSIISRDSFPPPRDYIATSGGIFRDMTIHDLDMARFFLPDIAEVSAFGSNTFSEDTREHGDFDTAQLVLRSADGALVSITNSRRSAYGYDQRLEAFGADGMLSVANAGVNLVSHFTASTVEARPPYQPFFLERYTEAYARELAAFVSLARGEQSSSPTFEDGWAALVLADAATESANSGRPVSVDLG